MGSRLRRWELWVWLVAVYALVVAVMPYLAGSGPAAPEPMAAPTTAEDEASASGSALGTRAEEAQPVSPLQAPILRYRVVSEGTRRAYLATSQGRLGEHLQALQADGYTLVRLTQIVDALYGDAPLPERAVALTFDTFNATLTDQTVALLRKRAVPAAFLVPPDRVGKPGAPTVAQLKAMATAGIDVVGAATLSTERTVQRTPDALRQQLLAVDERLVGLGVKPLPLIALGVVSPTQEEIRALALAGYHAAITLRSGAQIDPIHPYELPVISVQGDLSVTELRRRLVESTPPDSESTSPQ